MPKEKLELRVRATTDKLTATTELDAKGVLDDIKKELDAHKKDIFGTYGQEVKTQVINEKILKNRFQMSEKELDEVRNDANYQYVIYYTDSTGKQHKLPMLGTKDMESADETVFLNTLFDGVVTWLAETRFQLLEDGKKNKDAEAIKILDSYGSDVKKLESDMKKEIEKNVDNDVRSQFAELQKEILGDVTGFATKLLDRANTFAGTAKEMDALSKQIDTMLTNIDTALADKNLDKKKQKELNQLKDDLTGAKAALPVKYIDAFIGKYVTPHTPAADKDPLVLNEVAYAIELVDDQLAAATTKAEKHDLEQKKQALLSIQSQFNPSVENAEAQRSVDRFLKAHASLQTGLDGMSLDGLQGRKDEWERQHAELLVLYGQAQAKNSKILEPISTQISDIKTKFDELGNELDARISLEKNKTSLRERTDERKQILATEDLKKSGMPKEKWARDRVKQLDIDIKHLNAEQKSLQSRLDALTSTAAPITTLPNTPTNPNAPINLLPPSLPPAFDDKPLDVTLDGKKIKSLDALNKTTDLSEKDQKRLVEAFFGTKASSNPIERQTSRNALAPREMEYLMAYMKIALNDTRESRAESLRDLGKLNKDFNNEAMGTERDFKRLAKRLRAMAGDEKDKSEYTEKALLCAFEYAYYEQFNKQGLLMIEGLQANNRSMPAMQSIPTFWGKNTLGAMRGGDCEFGAFGEQMLRPIYGDGWNAEMIRILKQSKLCKKNPNAIQMLLEPHFYEIDLPGSAIHQEPGYENNAVIVPGKNDTFEVIGQQDNATLLATYLDGYMAKNVAGGAGVETKNTNIKSAYQLVRRWFTPGSYSFDVLGEVARKYQQAPYKLSPEQAHIKAQEFGEHLLEDTFKADNDLPLKIREAYHAQTDLYRTAFEKKQGQPLDPKKRNVDNIPESEKYKMLSRAAVRGFGAGFGLGSESEPMISDRLMSVFGGNRKTEKDGLVTYSNEEVGQDIARLINNQMKQPGYALSGRSVSDYGSVDRVLNQIEAHGVFDATGNLITTALQEYLPRLRPEQAKMLGSGLGTVAKWGTILWLAKTTRDRVGKGSGFRGKAWRVGSVGAGAMLFGKDLMALGFGGKGGTIAEALRYYTGKDKDFGAGIESSTEHLTFMFGNLSLNELFGLVEVDSTTGQFVMKTDQINKLQQSTGLSKEQKAQFNSFLKGSMTGLNQMINAGLKNAGIRPDNYKQILAESGSKTVREHCNERAIVTNMNGDLSAAFGLDANDPLLSEISQRYLLLENTALNPAQDRFRERVQEAKAFGTKRTEIDRFLNNHLVLHRPALIEALGGAGALSNLQGGFAKKTELATLRKNFILGEAPFSVNASSADNKAIFESEIKKLFNNEASLNTLLASSDLRGTLRSVLDVNTIVGDEKMTLDMNTADRQAWFLNRGGIGKKQYTELLVTNVPGTPGDAFIGVEKMAAASGRQEAFLTFWVPNADGKYEQWIINNVGAGALRTDGLGRVGTPAKFGIHLEGQGATTYETKYTDQLLWSAITAAKNGSTSYDLTAREYTPGVTPEKGKVTFSRTGKTR